MSVVVDGSGGITTNSGTVVSTTDATLNGLTVGKGGSAVSTNTALGYQALTANTSGDRNVAVGYQSAVANTTGINTSIGYQSLATNTTGTENTAVGFLSLNKNTTGNYNSGLSDQALYNNTTGSYNVSVGMQALQANTTASNNTAVGYQAGYNATGGNGTYFGYVAGYNTTGANNCFIGINSGYQVTTGAKNTILGAFQGNNGSLDIRTASNYIVLSDGDGNPRMYYDGAATNWKIPSGPLLVPYIYNTAGAGAGTVVVGTDGNLFRSSSSARYKKDIVDARYGLSDLLKLRAVNYKGNGEQDTDKLLGGLIAEEVDEAGLQEFVIYDDQQRPDALHYAQMVSLCVKSIQELKTIVDAQAALISGQATEIAELKAKVG
jgi:hypothetical protein